jgi:CheY-like chemotaxis protein
MTANVFKEDIQQSRDSGMNGHIGKPLDMEDVLSKLRKYLS